MLLLTHFDNVVEHDLELGDALRHAREVSGGLDDAKLRHLKVRDWK